jgi:hypothetical protein
MWPVSENPFVCASLAGLADGILQKASPASGFAF